MSGWCVTGEHEGCPDTANDTGGCSCPCHLEEKRSQNPDMSDLDSVPAAEIYRSSAAGRSFLARRDERGRFLPSRCDRIGCEAPPEASGRRFCAEHRQAHGRRLLAQVAVVVKP